MGLLSFPYWVLFEWLGPIVETIGIIYFLWMIIFATINWQIFIILSIFVGTFALFFSSFAVYYETFIFNRYKGPKFFLSVLGTAIAEMFFYHPLNVYFALLGNYHFFVKKDKKGWGNMTRTAFDK